MSCQAVKAVIVGDAAVGKTFLLRQKMNGVFERDVGATMVSAISSVDVKLDDETVHLDVG